MSKQQKVKSSDQLSIENNLYTPRKPKKAPFRHIFVIYNNTESEMTGSLDKNGKLLLEIKDSH